MLYTLKLLYVKNQLYLHKPGKIKIKCNSIFFLLLLFLLKNRKLLLIFLFWRKCIFTLAALKIFIFIFVQQFYMIHLRVIFFVFFLIVVHKASGIAG